MYNFKTVLVLKETADAEHDRREAYRAKDRISKFLGDDEFQINSEKCFIVQASPATRELFAKAGQCTSALVELRGDVGMQTKREYSAQGVTILAWKLPTVKKGATKCFEPSRGGRSQMRVGSATSYSMSARS